jgi:superfamily II DNA or RNA helicase
MSGVQIEGQANKKRIEGYQQDIEANALMKIADDDIEGAIGIYNKAVADEIISESAGKLAVARSGAVGCPRKLNLPATNVPPAASVKFKKAARYGLSATLSGGFKGVNKYLEAVFGPVVFSLTDQQLEAMDRATPLHVYVMNVTDGPAFSKSTQSLTMEKNGVWYNRQRNKLIQSCVDVCPIDQQLIIYVRTYAHIEELTSRYLGEEFRVFHGKLPEKQKKELLEGFNTGTIKRIISTDCLSEGVDPKNLYVIINANWMQSDTSVLQKAGRNRRLTDGKEFGVVIDFNDCWDDRMTMKSKNRLKHYESKGYKMIYSASPSRINFVEDE